MYRNFVFRKNHEEDDHAFLVYTIGVINIISICASEILDFAQGVASSDIVSNLFNKKIK